MARYQMTTERIACFERGFQIDGRARRQVAERRQRKSFVRYVGGERAIAQLDCRQTTALHTDAIADINSGRVESIESDQQPDVAAACLTTHYPADVLNDACEHSSPSSDYPRHSHLLTLLRRLMLRP